MNYNQRINVKVKHYMSSWVSEYHVNFWFNLVLTKQDCCWRVERCLRHDCGPSEALTSAWDPATSPRSLLPSNINTLDIRYWYNKEIDHRWIICCSPVASTLLDVQYLSVVPVKPKGIHQPGGIGVGRLHHHSTIGRHFRTGTLWESVCNSASILSI